VKAVRGWFKPIILSNASTFGYKNMSISFVAEEALSSFQKALVFLFIHKVSCPQEDVTNCGH
jgi:hypothetical protein